MAKKRKRRERMAEPEEVAVEQVDQEVTESVTTKWEEYEKWSRPPGWVGDEPRLPQPKDGDPTMKSPALPPPGAIENQLWLLGGHALGLKANIEALAGALPEGPTMTAVRAAAAASERARRNLIAALGSAAEAGQ